MDQKYRVWIWRRLVSELNMFDHSKLSHQRDWFIVSKLLKLLYHELSYLHYAAKLIRGIFFAKNQSQLGDSIWNQSRKDFHPEFPNSIFITIFLLYMWTYYVGYVHIYIHTYIDDNLVIQEGSCLGTSTFVHLPSISRVPTYWYLLSSISLNSPWHGSMEVEFASHSFMMAPSLWNLLSSILLAYTVSFATCGAISNLKTKKQLRYIIKEVGIQDDENLIENIIYIYIYIYYVFLLIMFHLITCNFP